MNSKAANDYRRKIKSREELLKIIGPRPRTNKVIMCHGTFDIVHPGHVRHLFYAKEKADILVTSLTCDAYISKANFRPFVPEQLRAMNLAALEVVDFVIIDQNPTPIENIEYIQPDYFAKGYEYTHGGLHPKTQEELDALESYGGEIIFTPGDVVYSSSNIIDNFPPNITAEKLAILMESEGITFDDVRSALNSFDGIMVHVLGDTIVDSYTYGTMIGGVTKTPTLSIKFEEQVDFAGGAAIVSKHLCKAGANVKFSTVLGDDDLKDFVLGDLEKYGVEADVVIDPTRPTTQKNAFIANNYRLLKVDKLDNRSISDKIVSSLQKTIAASQPDAFVYSDFRHGIFNRSTIPKFIDALPAGPFRVADSQVASRWGNILEFQGFDLITPNEREARFALGDQDSVVRPLALRLYNQANCKYLILKLGERGVITYRSGTPNDFRAFFSVDSFAEHVIDPVGSGDALLAYATLALVSTKSEVVATILGSLAAAVACEHEGNTPVGPDEVLTLLEIFEKRVNYA